MNRRILSVTAATASLFGTLFVAVAWAEPAPRLIWNASASAPIGFYRIDADAAPRVGDLVAIDPPPAVASFLAARGYLPRGLPILKRVAALPGALVCRSGTFVTIDGGGAARALARDRANRPLPDWTGCRTVGGGEIFLLNAPPDSLDGRYFGPLPAAGLIGTAHPLFTRSNASAPLRWRPGDDGSAASSSKKEIQDDHRNNAPQLHRRLLGLDPDARIRRENHALPRALF